MAEIKRNCLVIKVIGGFYYVKTDDGIIECHCRGIFRKEGISPVAGDYVEVEADNTQGIINKINPRRNVLIRPPLANIDNIVIISSTKEPEPNTLNIDKMTVITELKNIEPYIIFTKTDIESFEQYFNIYKKAGINVLAVSNLTGDGIEQFKSILTAKISVLTGNSGVGKTSLINSLMPHLNLNTSGISKKLGRGKHTTRQVELYELDDGGYVADTPGFSTLEISNYEKILKEDLQHAFREFKAYIPNCKFNGCSHIKEKGCAIIDAVNNGAIHESRYKSYTAIFNEIKNIKEWELNK